MGKVRFRKMTELEKQMSDDLDWARTAPEVREHPGKLVAIHKKCFLGAGHKRDSLVKKAAKKAGCPEDEVVITLVPPCTLTEAH